MRIFFVTNNYKPYSGGVISSIDATVNELRVQGHDVVIVTLDFLGDEHKDEEHVKRVSCPVRFMYKQNHMAIPWRPTYELLMLAKRYQPDIIHVHHPFLLGVSGLKVARALSLECVFTYHTLYEEYAHYVPFPPLCTKPIIGLLVKRFCEEVDGIIVPSNTVKHTVRAAGVLSPIEVIPSPVRNQFLSPCFVEPLAQSCSKQFFELLVVSRFTKEKNIPFVFDVFQKLPDTVRLTLVGYGVEYDALYNKAFNELCLPPERVRFVHKPEQHTLVEMYCAADLFLFPSRNDTQGIVIAEALSQGLPVIALDGPGQRDSIRNGENGFIITDEVSAAQVIKKLMGDGELHAHLRGQAYKTAHNYSSAAQVQQLLAFYETVSSVFRFRNI